MANTFSDSASPFDPYAPLTEPQVETAFPLDREIEGCGPGRLETTESIQYQGKTYTIISRDKVIAEDWLCNQVRAAAYARRRVEVYRGTPPSRAFIDTLLQTDLEV